MKGFVGDATALMELQPGEEIGEEIHNDRDQFFQVEKGKGEVWVDGTRTKIKSDTAIIVPAGAGNCQGLVGPAVLNGSPLSYWAGEAGVNPMRVIDGFVGGVWLTHFLADLNLGHSVKKCPTQARSMSRCARKNRALS